jgi:putative membrane protein
MDSNLVARSLSTLPNFLLFFVVAAALVAVFVFLYTHVTPWRELALIRKGNVAAAVSLAGALIGYVLPLAGVVANTHLVSDVVIWGIVAIVVQLLVWGAVTLLQPRLGPRIGEGDLAAAIFLAAGSIAGGIVNAACMVY